MAKISVITGAGAGVGRATAEEFARNGWNVALLSRDPERLERAAAELNAAYGVRTLPIPTDVADAEAMEAAADRVERELGPIDAWINVAMSTVFSPVADLTAAEVERGTRVTYLGQVHGMMTALKRMRTRDRGTIVNVGSALAYRSVPLQAIYCGAKAAIRGFTDSLRSEIIHDKLKVHLTMVDLPAVNTPQFDWALNKMGRKAMPVPPIYQPEACARVVVDVAQKPRRRTWVGEPTVFTILGNRFGSRIADAYLGRSGYKGQVDPALPKQDLGANLFEPRPGDQGAHGSFDDRALSWSPQIWAVRHRPQTVVLGLGALGALAAAVPVVLKRVAAG